VALCGFLEYDELVCKIRNRKTFTVPVDKQLENLSPSPPHRWTIYLSLAALSVSMVSAFWSFKSFNVASTNMQVGQRAYLNSQMTVPPEVWKGVVKENDEPPDATRTFFLTIIISNSGNTPALNVKVAPVLEDGDVHEGRHLSLPTFQYSDSDISPKSERRVDVQLEGLQDTVLGFLKGLHPKTEICLSLQFQDVFEQQHRDEPCFSIQGSEIQSTSVRDQSVSESYNDPIPYVVTKRKR
jgi:uncharacterized repeat protein (TIGR01451 family)